MEVERLARGANLALYTRTWGKQADLTAVWRKLEADGTITASYHLDLYLGLAREATLDGDPFWSTQFVFTPDGDPDCMGEFARRGINHYWLPPAVVHDECRAGKQTARFAHDVVFVGSEDYHPEWPYRPQLVGWLRDRYGSRFRRYGAKAEVVRGAPLNDLYASAKVVVGDSLCLPGHQRYWSDRVCETLGRGGFLIHPRVPGMDEFFTDREHLVFYDYGDWQGLGALIDYYLDRPGSRDRIRQAGQEHVKARHTYRHRLTEALGVMGFAADLEGPR